MKNRQKIPGRLYKYGAFSDRKLDMVIRDRLYYADPNSFNDPLDSSSSLELDLDTGQLEELVKHLAERRVSQEMSEAAEIINYRGPKTKDHIRRHSHRQAKEAVKDIENYAAYSDADSEDQKRLLLGRYIEEELLRQYDKGIVSFSERRTCPLMWSHYGDQHRGICIGYSVPDSVKVALFKVKYRAPRLVQASKVAAMLSGDSAARQQVDEAVLLRKARSWSYEKEWRLIGHRGDCGSPLEMEEITFGIRCKASAKYVLMQALKRRHRSIKFYEMCEVPGTFRLRRYALSYQHELFSKYPIRSLSKSELFQRLSDSAES